MTKIAPMLATSNVVPISNRLSLFRAWELRTGLRRMLGDGSVEGESLRGLLLDAITLKIFSRDARSPVALLGAPGAGKEHAARFIHRACTELLGRRGPLVVLEAGLAFAGLESAIAAAHDGTLVIQGVHAHPAELEGALLGSHGALVLVLVDLPAGRLAELPWSGLSIHLPALHERGHDIAELCRHFARSAGQPVGLGPDAVASLVAAARRRRIPGIDALRLAVHGHLFDACASGALGPQRTQPLPAPASDSPPAPSAGSLPPGVGSGSAGATFDPAQIQALARLHGVPAELLARQAALMVELISTLEGSPRSFRNIMDRSDVVRRIGLWLVTGAQGQSDFRHAFGRQRFMQPSKSSAWAFFNTVFKREE